MTRKSFSNLPVWLPAQLKKSGIKSWEQLARKAGVSRASIYFWLRDDDRPTTASMAKLCKALKVPLAEGLKQYSEKPRGNPHNNDKA
jgi:transcriptional regulator with XRE-family HTH domain